MKRFLLLILPLLLAACGPRPAVPPPTATSIPATPTEAGAAGAQEIDHLTLLRRLLFEVNTREGGKKILAQIENTGDTRFVAGLIDVLRYQRALSPEISATLNALIGPTGSNGPASAPKSRVLQPTPAGNPPCWGPLTPISSALSTPA